MLQRLRIRNLALLDQVALDFEAGFTAVTGETGAGKSILLGALSLLAGARADRAMIRQGADACEVEAELWLADSRRFDAALEEMGLPACEEGLLVLRRALPRDKPPRITINGSAATLANLQRLGELWIDFHGPGEPRRLLKPECQLELLDGYGKCAALASAYGEVYRQWRERLAEIERLNGESRLDEDQIQFLQGQINKIDSAEISPEGIEELERDFRRLSRAQEIGELSSELAAGLSGEGGALERLGALVRLARQLESADPSARPLADRLNSLAVEAEDLSREYEALGEASTFEPEQAEAIGRRMNLWLELKRKHGTVERVLSAREEMARKLAEQGDIEGLLARWQKEAAKLETEARAKAGQLREARVKAGATLTRKAMALAGELGFRKAELRLAMEPEADLRPHGDARPELLFSPNVGEPLLPLSRVASSGELARVMLALKTALAEVDDIPLLVFDEVDANVGGEIGRAVGEKMAEISARHQVFCVTHLPQVAAQAAQHLLVEKDQSGERASVSIGPIHGNRKSRIGELARMLGDRKAKSALAHAEELLGGPA
jgi:DNA repair protein RecN (Recombination protein N)